MPETSSRDAPNAPKNLFIKEKAISALNDDIEKAISALKIKRIETDILTLGETFKTDAKK
ncbi:10688_t:CDS:2, partial [Racocetra persica]